MVSGSQTPGNGVEGQQVAPSVATILDHAASNDGSVVFPSPPVAGGGHVTVAATAPHSTSTCKMYFQGWYTMFKRFQP